MVQVGVKELKTHTSAILRRVEGGQTVEITRRGAVVAYLVPVRRVSEEERAKRWAELKRISEEIGKHWPPEISAVEAVRDVRREL